MKRTTIVVMIVTLLSKIFGFLRDKIIWYFFGVGVVSDAFMLAYGVPSLILTVVAAAFVTGFIPMYTNVKENESEEAANDFVNNIFNIMGFLALGLGILMLIFPGAMVKVAASGFNKETYDLAAQFVRIMSISIISIALIQLGTGYLNVNQSFVLPNVITIPSNLIVIGTTVIAHKTGQTTLLPYGALVGYLLQSFIIYMYMRRFGFRYKFHMNFKDPNLMRMIYLAGPILISTVVLSVSDLIRMNAATIIHGEGGYSFIMMSTRLFGFASGLFVVGALSVAYPTIAQAASRKDKAQVVYSMNDAIAFISLFVIPTTIGAVLLSHEIVTFVYGGGEVLPQDLIILGGVFMADVFGLYFYALKELFLRIFYSFQDSVTPLKAQILHAISGIVLFFVLGYTLGISGLPLATSIAVTISGGYLCFNLLKMFNQLGMGMIIHDLGKILLSSIIMGLTVYFGKKFFIAKMSLTTMFLVVVILAVLVYGTLLFILDVKVFKELIPDQLKR